MYLFYYPQLTLAKVLMVEGGTDNLQRADDLLSRLNEFVSRTHNNCFLINVLILQTQLHDLTGNESTAKKCLSKAVSLAQPRNLIRPFVDVGPEMAKLLIRFATHNLSGGYVAKLLATFRKEGAGTMGTAPIAPLSSSHSLLDESLTNRELEILALLARRMSNKEIAEKLFISPKTAKRHLYNIYQKLNVSTRRQAVEKASALNLVSDP
jgi:LuxR family maltose regulon positive regulatory protein